MKENQQSLSPIQLSHHYLWVFKYEEGLENEEAQVDVVRPDGTGGAAGGGGMTLMKLLQEKPHVDHEAQGEHCRQRGQTRE